MVEIISLLGESVIGGLDLWELLSRKKVNIDLITEDDVKKYKSIMEMASAYLHG